MTINLTSCWDLTSADKLALFQDLFVSLTNFFDITNTNFFNSFSPKLDPKKKEIKLKKLEKLIFAI